MTSSITVIRRRNIQAAAPVVRKYRRLRRRRCLRMEYKKLRSLLPGSPNTTPQLKKKVGVVDAAYQYICELQTALLAKFSAKGLPADLAGVLGGNQVTSASDIQALAIHLIKSGQVGLNNQQQQKTLIRPTTSSISLQTSQARQQQQLQQQQASHRPTASGYSGSPLQTSQVRQHLQQQQTSIMPTTSGYSGTPLQTSQDRHPLQEQTSFRPSTSAISLQPSQVRQQLQEQQLPRPAPTITLPSRAVFS